MPDSMNASDQQLKSNVKQVFVYWLEGYTKIIISRNVLVILWAGREECLSPFNKWYRYDSTCRRDSSAVYACSATF